MLILGILTGGVSEIHLDQEIRDRLDKLLGYVESKEGVVTNGTMLILEDSCLFSRFSLHESRMVLLLNRVRPMGNSSVKYVPVYVQGTWQNLYLFKMQSFVLVLLTSISTKFDQVEKYANDFKSSFTRSRLEVPTESPSSICF